MMPKRAIRFLGFAVGIVVVFIAVFLFWNRVLYDDHREPVTGQEENKLFIVIAQSHDGPVALWGREELARFQSGNKEARYLIRPEEIEKVRYHFNEGKKDMTKAIGVFADDIMNGKQIVRLTIEDGPGLYSFTYEASESGIEPLYRTRYTIDDGLKPLFASALTTVALIPIVGVARKARIRKNIDNG